MHHVFLAGIGNSEPGHWQSIWFRALGGRWVEHSNWDAPDAATWAADLDRELRSLGGGPKVLIAHSLGCLLAVEWARRNRDAAEVIGSVIGSFLVAPPDVAAPSFPRAAVGFHPAASGKPPLPALVVASADDPYCSFASACAAAAAWGAPIESAGACGHINLASNIGAWPEGRALFDRFVAGLGPLRP